MAKAKLNQIIAIEKGIKSGVYSQLTELHKASQKAELFNGFQKTYQKKDDDGESLPSEGKRVQFTVGNVLQTSERILSELMEVTARKDWTNSVATADVVVDDKPILSGVLVTYLLFMEKQMTDYRTFVANLPVLDVAEDWDLDVNSGLFKTEATSTHRTKKVQRPLVLYPATPEHPAQTQLVTEDIIAGFWETVKQSGAMPAPEKAALLARVEKLLKAVKEARESANMAVEVEAPNVGTAVFNYLLKQ